MLNRVVADIKAVSYEVKNVSKDSQSNLKKQYKWVVEVDSVSHTITLFHSKLSGYVEAMLDGKQFLERVIPAEDIYYCYFYAVNVKGCRMDIIHTLQGCQLSINENNFSQLYREQHPGKDQTQYSTFHSQTISNVTKVPLSTFNQTLPLDCKVVKTVDSLINQARHPEGASQTKLILRENTQTFGAQLSVKPMESTLTGSPISFQPYSYPWQCPTLQYGQPQQYPQIPTDNSFAGNPSGMLPIQSYIATLYKPSPIMPISPKSFKNNPVVKPVLNNYQNMQNLNMAMTPSINNVTNLPNMPNQFNPPFQQQSNNVGLAPGRNSDSQKNTQQTPDSLFSHPFTPFLAQRLAGIVNENIKRPIPSQNYPIPSIDPVQQPILPPYQQQFRRPYSNSNKPSSAHNFPAMPFASPQYPQNQPQYQLPPNIQPIYNVDLNRPFENTPQLRQQSPIKLNPFPQQVQIPPVQRPPILKKRSYNQVWPNTDNLKPLSQAEVSIPPQSKANEIKIETHKPEENIQQPPTVSKDERVYIRQIQSFII